MKDFKSLPWTEVWAIGNIWCITNTGVRERWCSIFRRAICTTDRQMRHRQKINNPISLQVVLHISLRIENKKLNAKSQEKAEDERQNNTIHTIPLIWETSVSRCRRTTFSASSFLTRCVRIIKRRWTSKSLPEVSRKRLYARSNACPIVSVMSSACSKQKLIMKFFKQKMDLVV